jgi:tetratricopeptide (TPR) repeat protein
MLRGTVVLFPVLMLGIGLTPLLGQRGGGAASAPGAQGPYLSGHVTLEDGSAPTERVIIQSMCAGRIRDETTVDRKGGGFGFTLGRGSGDLMLDATNQANRASSTTPENPRECSVQAVLQGYLSDVIYLANLTSGKSDVGTIILHKAGNAAAAGPSETARQASKDARKAFDKGMEAAKNSKWPDAAANFKKATDLFPGYADAWLELGKAQVALKQVDEARKSLEASIKADEKYAPPYILLAPIEFQALNFKSVTDLSSRLLKITPAIPPQIWFWYSAAHFRLGNYDAAESVSGEGLKADIQHQAPKLHEVLASCMIVRNDSAGAAAQLKQYLEEAPLAPDAASIKAKIAELETQAQAAPAK